METGKAGTDRMNLTSKALETLAMARELADVVRANFDNPMPTKDDIAKSSALLALDRIDESLTDIQVELKYTMMTLRAKVLERLG